MKLAASCFNPLSFFPEDEWIPTSDWPPNVVQGKSYETTDERGLSIWQQVEDRLKFYKGADALPAEVTQVGPRFGKAQLTLPRLGQGSFRVLVTDAYKRRCARKTSAWTRNVLTTPAPNRSDW